MVRDSHEKRAPVVELQTPKNTELFYDFSVKLDGIWVIKHITLFSFLLFTL